MRHEFTPEAWPEVRDMKIITMIKQVVSKASFPYKNGTYLPLSDTQLGMLAKALEFVF